MHYRITMCLGQLSFLPLAGQEMINWLIDWLIDCFHWCKMWECWMVPRGHFVYPTQLSTLSGTWNVNTLCLPWCRVWRSADCCQGVIPVPTAPRGLPSRSQLYVVHPSTSRLPRSAELWLVPAGATLLLRGGLRWDLWRLRLWPLPRTVSERYHRHHHHYYHYYC